MPRQQGEPAFAANEQLYRLLLEDWIDTSGRVRAAAIDLQGTSVDRGLMVGDPFSCLASAEEKYVAIGAIAFCDVPDRFEAPSATSYESVVVYKPEHGNAAHSEIQFWRSGDTTASKPQSNALKSQIRERLAEGMRIAHRRESVAP